MKGLSTLEPYQLPAASDACVELCPADLERVDPIRNQAFCEGYGKIIGY